MTPYAIVFFCTLLSVTFETNNASEICAYYGLLKPIKEFYSPQPVTVNVTISFADFYSTVDEITEKLDLFTKTLANYSSNEKIKTTESQKLIPFDNERNLILINFGISCFATVITLAP